ncbi:MAG TPA: hypothetical protein VJ997_06415, partial [Longimicrobiales bacterium]|nr:hypothetical protein [Longimicrobiales bacterium]
MTWAKTTEIHNGPAVGGVPLTGATDESITTQRVFDEFGILQVRFGAAPGTVTGSVVLQGRLDSTAEWSDVYNSLGRVEIVGTAGAVAFTTGPAYEGIPVLPEMRASFDNYTTTNSTNVRVYITE